MNQVASRLRIGANLALLTAFLFVSVAAFAQGATPAPQPSFSQVLGKMLPMFVVVFLVFHFMIIRPQKQREQSHAELIKGLKNGESVVTSSGIIGRVAGIAPGYVTLEVASGVKMKFETAHVLKREEAKKEDAAKK